uniref:Uncharacterized protein n=2 Tax=Panagrolaimus sp. JU765 TaxID=591449 RepID=A0AC34R846_9BILA
LCMESPHLASLCVEDPAQYKTKEQYMQHIKIQKHGAALADIIGHLRTRRSHEHSRTKYGICEQDTGSQYSTADSLICS